MENSPKLPTEQKEPTTLSESSESSLACTNTSTLKSSPRALDKKTRERLTRKQIIETAMRRVALVAQDLTYCAEPEPEPNWSGRRKKVWKDGQMSAKESPVYLSLLGKMAQSLGTAEAEAGTTKNFGVIVLGASSDISKDEWKKQAEAVEAESRARPIDVKVLSDGKGK